MKKKVQHFLWRSCNNSLPVNLNMLRRGIHIDAICNQCGMEPESVEHVMFKCTKAQLVWKLAPVRWDGILEYQNTFKEWWRNKGDSTLKDRIQERLEISAYLFWHLWKARNENIFRGNARSEKRIVDLALNEWLEYKEETERSQGRRFLAQVHQEQEQWSKPEKGFVRLSVSSIAAPESRSIGCGFHAKNDQGVLLQAWAVIREGSSSPVITDLEAIRAAMICAHQQGWGKLEIQSDSKALVQCLNLKGCPTQDSLTIAEDIYLLTSMFVDCKFLFGHRKWDRTSVALASFALEESISKSWKNVFPSWIVKLDQDDSRSVDPM